MLNVCTTHEIYHCYVRVPHLKMYHDMEYNFAYCVLVNFCLFLEFLEFTEYFLILVIWIFLKVFQICTAPETGPITVTCCRI